MHAHDDFVKKVRKNNDLRFSHSDQSEQTCIAVKKLTANELPLPSANQNQKHKKSSLRIKFDAWIPRLVKKVTKNNQKLARVSDVKHNLQSLKFFNYTYTNP